MKIVLVGAPASGKGTLASSLSKEYGLVHISTGDIFREILAGNSSLKQEVESYVNNGLLVPDELTLKLVLNRLSNDDVKNGYILDGFPRTLVQAKMFSQNVDIDYAIYLDVKYETLLERTLNRLVCPNCKKIFVKTKYNSDCCDECNTKLTTRADDNEETVAKRYNVFKESTYPLVSYYQDLGKLVYIDASGTPDEVLNSVKSKISR